MEKTYEKFRDDDLILRDRLAIDRTVLANERTLLAYIRTAIAIVISGGTLIKFVDGFWFHLLGIILLVVGIATMTLGFWRYKIVNKAIAFDQRKAK